jgi:hypothetical protein
MLLIRRTRTASFGVMQLGIAASFGLLIIIRVFSSPPMFLGYSTPYIIWGALTLLVDGILVGAAVLIWRKTPNKTLFWILYLAYFVVLFLIPWSNFLPDLSRL